MAKPNQTIETNTPVEDFLNTISDPAKRADSFRILELLEKHTGYPPKMWGPAIIGFGSYHYTYASGREGDAPLAGFSPRKEAITIYLESEFDGKEEMLAKLGKHKSSKVCVYIKKLDDIDQDVLKKMVTASMKHTQKQYPDKKDITCMK